VEREFPSACATVSWKVCKSAIALCCLYFNLFKRECVTKVLINPIIRTRTRLIRRVYQPTRHSIYFLMDLYCTAERSYRMTDSTGLNIFLTDSHLRLAQGFTLP
jgi:hypothetical protein